MDIKPWKKHKRTGAVKRKLSKAYSHHLEQKKPQSDQTNQSSGTAVQMSRGSVQLKDNIDSDITDPESFQKDSISSGNESTSDDDNEDHRNSLFRDQIKTWAIEKNVPQTTLKALSKIINDRFPYSLPQDPRTILHTVTNVAIKSIENNGEYWHNGLINQLTFFFENLLDVLDIISLNINFDGLPIFKSSRNEFWPILCAVHEYPGLSPFIIGIYYGSGKPKNIEVYLEDFVTEISKLLKDGIYLQQKNKQIKIKIRCFVCDSPARAFIKGVCNFNGKHGCLKCTTVGEYSHSSHTVVFPDSRCPLRTDEGFRSKLYGQHHKTDSPLLQLPIDMVNDFPVADCLHLIDLGIMKRLLIGWRDGNFGKYDTKWCSRDINTVQIFLSKCKMPSEIHRSIRGIDCLAHWKASEYRTFFFYLSIVILPDVLPQDAFVHFLFLYCAITICSSENYKHLIPISKDLLLYFVEHYKDFYSSGYVTSNVHNLVHLTDEVDKFGPLHTFSAYPFENKLFSIKRMLRCGHKPLAQVAKRLCEASKDGITHFISKENSDLPRFINTGKHNAKIMFKDFVLSTKHQDKYFMTKNDKIAYIRSISDASDIHCSVFTRVSEVFELPLKSSLFNIFKAERNNDQCSDVVVLHVSDVKMKLICIEHKQNQYFIPLLHTV